MDGIQGNKLKMRLLSESTAGRRRSFPTEQFLGDERDQMVEPHV
jgi:hypothetical protein